MINTRQDVSAVSAGLTTYIGLGVTAAQAAAAAITWWENQDEATLTLFIGAITTLLVTLGGRFKQADSQIKASALVGQAHGDDDDLVDDHDDRAAAAATGMGS